MLIINFEGREVKGLSKGRYDETFAGEDDVCMKISEYPPPPLGPPKSYDNWQHYPIESVDGCLWRLFQSQMVSGRMYL